MATHEIEEQITELEEAYAAAVNRQADVNALSIIWRRLKELREEMKKRK